MSQLRHVGNSLKGLLHRDTILAFCTMAFTYHAASICETYQKPIMLLVSVLVTNYLIVVLI